MEATFSVSQTHFQPPQCNKAQVTSHHTEIFALGNIPRLSVTTPEGMRFKVPLLPALDLNVLTLGWEAKKPPLPITCIEINSSK